MVGGMSLNAEEANVRIVRCLDFVIGILRKSQRQAHVGLAAADPDISNKHIVQLDSLVSGYLHRVRAAGSRRLNLHLPAMISALNAGCAVIGNLDLHFVTRIGPTPDGVGLASLKDHVVAKDRADKGKRLCGCGCPNLTRCGLRECSADPEEQKTSDSGLYPPISKIHVSNPHGLTRSQRH